MPAASIASVSTKAWYASTIRRSRGARCRILSHQRIDQFLHIGGRLFAQQIERAKAGKFAGSGFAAIHLELT